MVGKERKDLRTWRGNFGEKRELTKPTKLKMSSAGSRRVQGKRFDEKVVDSAWSLDGCQCWSSKVVGAKKSFLYYELWPTGRRIRSSYSMHFVITNPQTETLNHKK